MERLRELLQWLSSYNRQLLIRQHEEEPETEDAKVREAVGKHFRSQRLSLPSLPCRSPTTRDVWACCFMKAATRTFSKQAHIEMIKVLAGQTTVAIRNALLYREVPLIGLLEPLVQRKQAFLRSESKASGFDPGQRCGGYPVAHLLPPAATYQRRRGGGAAIRRHPRRTGRGNHCQSIRPRRPACEPGRSAGHHGRLVCGATS